MSDTIRELAEARRRRYESLSEAEKPKVTKCPSCGEATYKLEVCPETGLFHELEKKKLIGGSIVDRNVIQSSELMRAIDRTRVRWVPSRTQLVKADAQSLNIFQTFVSQLDWNLQRYGILYGLYIKESETIEVHAVYEPEQYGNRHTFEVVEDKRIHLVDQVAKGLGLRRVGVVCSHPPRDPDVCLLTSREMLLCAREQSRFGDECVLLTVAPGPAETSPASGKDYFPSSASATAQQAVIQCQAWQTSPQCVYLYRLGVLHESVEGEAEGNTVGARETATTGVSGGHPSGRVEESSSAASAQRQRPAQKASDPSLRPPPMSVLEEARYVASTMDLELTQQDTDKNGKQRFVTKAPSKRIDTRWFTSFTAVQQFQSEIVRSLFMRISRPGMDPPTFDNLRNYFQSAKRKNDSFAEKLADFHVLVFLADSFANKDDVIALAHIARNKVMTEEARNYEAILKEYIGS